MQATTIAMETLYSTTGTAQLADLPKYEQIARDLAGNGNEVVLTGQGPIWLYLRIAHALHGKVRTLRYDSPVTGEVLVYDHSPFDRSEPQRRRERREISSLDSLTEIIIGAAIKVHKTLGPGLLESAYQKCLECELKSNNIWYESEKIVPLTYGNLKIDTGYRLDMLVEDSVIVENKTVERIMPIHEAQLLTYLKLTGCKVGLLLNWNVPALKDGIKRMVLNYQSN